MYQVEKNIPMPRPYVGRPHSGEEKYPIRQMEVGDSFFVPLAEGQKTESLRGSINANINKKKLRQEGLRFATRNMEGGLRVWRLPDEETK